MSFTRSEMLDVSHLNRVVHIDTATQTAIVEPNVPLDELLKKTSTLGLLPPVVMEFPGITVDGGIQGGAGESSSWKWGCFNEACDWYEMALPDDKRVTTSANENPDLFYGTVGSFGSLGVITADQLQLVPAKKYVVLHYLPVHSFEDALQTLQQCVQSKSYDYIDGIMFSPKGGLIIVGSLSDTKQGKLQKFSRAFDEWFYLHAESISKRGKPTVESVPLADYLFRYDRGAFWVGKYAFDRSGIPFNRFTRFLANHLMHTRKLYQALQESGAAQQYIIQDMTVPETAAIDFMNYIDKKLHTYPLWLCPMKPDKNSALLSNNLQTKLAINVGILSGTAIYSYEEFVSINRDIEKQLRVLKGKKWFYAQSYYTEDEFWNIYDKS